MSDTDDNRRDPRQRPADPAGTQPKHDPSSLLPQEREPLLADPEVVEAQVVEEPAAEPSYLPARRPAPGAPAPREPAQPHTKWTPRFQFLFGALVAIAVAAVAAIVVIALTPGEKQQPTARWSSWAPADGDDAGAQEIAEHVGASYRLNNGRQLVQVSVGPLEIEGIPLAIAVRETPAQGGNIETFDDGGLIYRLCGLGPDCAIASGKSTPQRHLLLRRESLELALYSFHYLGVKSVVVFLPPPRGEKPTQAMFFRPNDLASQLARPIGASLATKPPLPSAIAVSPDAPLVSKLTTPKVFTFSFTQANTDNKGIIVLDPFDGSKAASTTTTTTTTTTTSSSG